VSHQGASFQLHNTHLSSLTQVTIGAQGVGILGGAQTTLSVAP
jgi:hypothetical protein